MANNIKALYRIPCTTAGEKNLRALEKEFLSLGLEPDIEIKDEHYWLSVSGTVNYKPSSVVLPARLKPLFRGSRGFKFHTPIKGGPFRRLTPDPLTGNYGITAVAFAEHDEIFSNYRQSRGWET